MSSAQRKGMSLLWVLKVLVGLGGAAGCSHALSVAPLFLNVTPGLDSLKRN